MRAFVELSEEDIELIGQSYIEGKSFNYIMENFNITRNCAQKLAKLFVKKYPEEAQRRNKRFANTITDEEWKDMEQMYRAGVYIKDIAAKYGKGASMLCGLLKKRFPDVAQGKKRSNNLIKNISDSDWIDIEEMYKSGMFIKDIAKKYDVCEDTLGIALKKRGLYVNSKEFRKYNTPRGILQFNKKEDWQPIYDEYVTNKSLRQLAKELCIKITVIEKAFEFHGFQRVSKDVERQRCIDNTKQALLEKYGVDAPFKNKEILDKTRKTMIEKYGVANPGQVDEFKEKIKQTCLKKYGVPATTYLNSMKEKSKKTCLERYGTEHYTQTNEYKERAKKTCLEKYGVEHYVLSEDMRGKVISTSLEKYGVEHYTKSDKYKEESHIRQTLQHKDEVLRRLEGTGLTMLDEYDGIYSKITKNYIYYNFRCDTCGHEFKMELNQVPVCPKCMPNASTNEIELEKFIRDNYNGEIQTRIRFENKEIDLLLPELHLGFEVNGCYWHSAIDKPKKYHQNKTDIAQRNNINLIHLWDYYPRSKVYNRIKTLLGLNEKVYARNTIVKIVEKNIAKEFFEANHLDGYTQAMFTLGLYSKDNELLSAISFRKHKEGIEIARFATKEDITVVAGFSKLIKHSIDYIKEHYSDVKKIITYCDRDWTPDYTKSAYYKNGFTFVGNSGPMLKYFNLRKQKIIARQQLQKHKLKALFPEEYDEALTANEILYKAKIVPLYNSGNWKFERNI